MGKILKNGIIYGGGSSCIEITQEEYNALSEAEKMNGTPYFISDAEGGGGSGSTTVIVNAELTEGTEIAKITVNDKTTALFAPSNSGGGVTEDEVKTLIQENAVNADYSSDTTIKDKLDSILSSNDVSELIYTNAINGKYTDTQTIKDALNSAITETQVTNLIYNNASAGKYSDTQTIAEAISNVITQDTVESLIKSNAISADYSSTQTIKQAIDSKLSSIPTATTSTLGGIKVGDNLTISSDGTLSADTSTANLPFINVVDEGVSHEFTDQTANIQAVIDAQDSPAILYFEPGYYKIDGTLNVNKSNLWFIGNNATLLVVTSPTHIFYISNYTNGSYETKGNDVTFIDNVVFEGFRVTGDNSYFLEARGVSNFKIKDIYHEGGLVSFDAVFNIDAGDGSTDPTVNAGLDSYDKCNKHIWIDNCYGNRYNATESENPDSTVKGIYCNFCYDVHISNCTLYGYGQGIECWGGNALYNYSGQWQAAQWCKDIFVDNCKVDFCRGGGIWGSECENFIISNCSVSTCNDVGYDFESCRNSMVTDSVVKNCKTSNLSTYSNAENIVFKNVISLMEVGLGCDLHYLHNNATLLPAEITVTLEGCTFTSERSSYGITQLDSFKQMTVRDCEFNNVCWNCKIASDGSYTNTSAASFPNQMFTTFVNNKMRYPVITATLTRPPFSAMLCATVNGYYQIVASNNDIYSEESTSSGYDVAGFYIQKTSTLPDIVIDGNKIDSCSSTDIKFGSLSGTVLVKDNIIKHSLGSSSYCKSINNYTFSGTAI